METSGLWIFVYAVIAILLIFLLIYAIHYINKYNITNDSLQTCNTNLNNSNTLLGEFRNLAIPLSSVTAHNLAINQPVILTYDPTGQNILVPITDGGVTNVGLAPISTSQTNYMWYVSNANGVITIMDQERINFLNVPEFVEGIALTLTPLSTNANFNLSTALNGANGALTPVADPSFTVYSDTTEPNLLKISNLVQNNQVLYAINPIS